MVGKCGMQWYCVGGREEVLTPAALKTRRRRGRRGLNEEGEGCGMQWHCVTRATACQAILATRGSALTQQAE